MHILGIVVTIGVGIYTTVFAVSLLKDGNLVGAVWSFLLTAISVAANLYYYYQHGFLP